MPSETVSEGIAFVPPFLHHGQCGPVDSSSRFSYPKKDGFSAINRHGSKPVAIPVQTSPPPHNQWLTLFRLNFYAPYFLSADSDFFPFLTKRFSGDGFSLFLVGKHQEKHALQTKKRQRPFFCPCFGRPNFPGHATSRQSYPAPCCGLFPSRCKSRSFPA